MCKLHATAVGAVAAQRSVPDLGSDSMRVVPVRSMEEETKEEHKALLSDTYSYPR